MRGRHGENASRWRDGTESRDEAVMRMRTSAWNAHDVNDGERGGNAEPRRSGFRFDATSRCFMNNGRVLRENRTRNNDRAR